MNEISSGRRKLLIGASALLAGPFAVLARGARASRTVAILYNSKFAYLAGENAAQRRFMAAFNRLGWVENENITFRHLVTDGIASRLRKIVRELVAERVDLIWATTTSAAVAAVQATKTIPILLAGASAYPVECGLIESFAHPGGNVTGVAFFQGISVHAKLAQFARHVLPAAKRLAWIAFPPDLATVGGGEFRPESYYREATRNLGFELAYYECRRLEEFDSLFDALRARQTQAAIFEPAGLSSIDGIEPIARLALGSRMPTFFSTNANVRGGGLLSYGPKWSDVLDRSVSYADRILRGAKPLNLPVEMPNKLQLEVNLRTAKALGLTIAPALLLQADRVIE